MPESTLTSPIAIVSGLPRSGTSMMMRMLAAGGVTLITDAVRQPDDSNSLGFFEDERVKQLPAGNVGWLSAAGGRAVKVVSPLLRFLPSELSYRVIFMQRPLDEVMASQRAMLRASGAAWQVSQDGQVRADYERHLNMVLRWLPAQANMRVLCVDYGDAVQHPEPHGAAIARFLERALDVAGMAAAVDRSLHHQHAIVPVDSPAAYS
jgi:hypothetical protein